MPRGSVDKEQTDYLKTMTQDIKRMTTVNDMREEKFVKTILTGFNRASGVGGVPLGHVILIHGPNQVGKSVLAMALAESMRRAGHVSMIYDAEHAGEKEWYSSITPKSGYKEPDSLDEVIDDIRKMIVRLKKGHAAKKTSDIYIPEHVGCCWVADTLTELLPQETLDKIDEKGVKKMYPIQAAYFSTFFKWIIPKLRQLNSTLIAVLQERANTGAKGLPYEDDFKIAGGYALQYDNRMRIRVGSAGKIRAVEKGPIVAREIRYRVENNKFVGTTFEKGVLFTAIGSEDGVPKGLDLVREALFEGRLRGCIENKGGAIVARIGGKLLFKIPGGWKKALVRLRAEPKLFKELVGRLNSEV